MLYGQLEAEHKIEKKRAEEFGILTHSLSPSLKSRFFSRLRIRAGLISITRKTGLKLTARNFDFFFFLSVDAGSVDLTCLDVEN